MDDRRSFLQKFLGAAVAPKAQEITKKVVQPLRPVNLRDLPNWKMILGKMFENGNIFFNDSFNAVRTNHWGDRADVIDTRTGVKIGEKWRSELREEFPEVYERWVDQLVGMNPDNIESQHLPHVVERLGKAQVDRAFRVQKALKKLERIADEKSRIYKKFARSFNCGASGFERQLAGEQLHRVCYNPISTHCTLKATPEDFALRKKLFVEWTKKCDELMGSLDGEYYKKLRGFIEERKELEKKIRRMRNDWRRKIDGFDPTARNPYSNRDMQEGRIRVPDEKRAAQRLNRKYKKLMRPTGKELILTPEWELGPSGPGQFVRAIRDRYV